MAIGPSTRRTQGGGLRFQIVAARPFDPLRLGMRGDLLTGNRCPAGHQFRRGEALLRKAVSKGAGGQIGQRTGMKSGGLVHGNCLCHMLKP